MISKMHLKGNSFGNVNMFNNNNSSSCSNNTARRKLNLQDNTNNSSSISHSCNVPANKYIGK